MSPMEIKNCRRLLFVGPPDADTLTVVEGLTGSRPSLNECGTTAGLTHEWNVQTPYYSARVPIWIDDISDVDAWKKEFLWPEAREVVEAVGAWVLCVRKPRDGTVTKDAERLMEAIKMVVPESSLDGEETRMLVVFVPSSQATGPAMKLNIDWDDFYIQHGFEPIDLAETGSNEFGEKAGFARLKEALEANEWEATSTSRGDPDLDDVALEFEDDTDGLTRDEAEMTAELFDMKAALSAGNDYEYEQRESSSTEQENQVQSLDRLMGRILAVKEQSADLPEAQRRSMAANAVRDLMRDGSIS